MREKREPERQSARERERENKRERERERRKKTERAKGRDRRARRVAGGQARCPASITGESGHRLGGRSLQVFLAHKKSPPSRTVQ